MKTDGAIPSKTFSQYWIQAASEHPQMRTKNVGKWLLFVPESELDLVWGIIKKQTENGLLGHASKASTAAKNPNSTDSKTKVICVYTYDYTDVTDVMRVRKKLRELGFKDKIPYKTDTATKEGLYSKNGSENVSLYFE